LPTLKKALESDGLNLISIVNTHQYVSLILDLATSVTGRH
jgi:hypothetical protein